MGSKSSLHILAGSPPLPLPLTLLVAAAAAAGDDDVISTTGGGWRNEEWGWCLGSEYLLLKLVPGFLRLHGVTVSMAVLGSVDSTHNNQPVSLPFLYYI